MKPCHGRRKGFLIAAFLSASLPAFAQFQAGQYTDEAPFRTWNSFPFVGASALGQGGAAYAWGASAAASLANPALLLTLPRTTVSLGGS